MSGMLLDCLVRHRIVVCVGGGGVGKTTTAAALALEAARRGRRTVVLTVDPARRLKDALGLKRLGDTPRRVPLSGLGQVEPGGRLEAMVLDVKRTFDSLVLALAPDDATAEAILHNRLYHTISGALGGSAEYMAMEKLYQLAGSAEHDLLVVDTPPSRHAMDFLDAPARLLALLDSRALAVLRNPAIVLARSGSRVAELLLTAMLRTLERFTGIGLVGEVSEFVGRFEGLYAGLRERAAAVQELMRGPETAFLLVAAPDGRAVSEAVEFARALVAARLPLRGIIVNRLLPQALVRAADRQELPPSIDPGLATKLALVHRELAELAASQRRAVGRLVEAAAGAPLLAEAPLLPTDPASLADLVRLGEFLFRARVGRRGARRSAAQRAHGT